MPLWGTIGVSLLLGQSCIDWWEMRPEQTLGASSRNFDVRLKDSSS